MLKAKARADPSHALGAADSTTLLLAGGLQGGRQRGDEEDCATVRQDGPKLPNTPSGGYHTGDKADGAPLQPSLGISLKPS